MIKNSISQFSERKNAKSFGLLPNGDAVICYTLTNKNGAELSVINFGATITSLKIPISNGKKVDVVLGFETLEDYINSYNLPGSPYIGTIVGRYAGRINNAEFTLNGKLISLKKNHGNHCLHGGKECFSTKFWNVKSISENENPSISLQYTSANNEENFPGEMKIEVTYTLTEENELIIKYNAIANEDTIINLTQHSYFNLDGQNGSVLNQELEINSKKILEVDSENIPSGRFINLENSPFNFTSPKNSPQKIDTSFVLESKDEFAASLYNKNNGLKMIVYTDQPSVHVYVGGNCFDIIKGKENTKYHADSGICFETQNFPDAPNHSHFPNSVLKKGETYLQKTIFKFENV